MLGVNYYTRPGGPRRRLDRRRPGGDDGHGVGDPPSSLGTLLRELHERYRFPRYLVTENGAAMPDTHRRDGRVDDHDRIAYLAAHLAEVHDAIESGVPVEGYFVWSLLDNFEWAHGFAPRFGIDTRSPRARWTASPRPAWSWYAGVTRSNALAG